MKKLIVLATALIAASAASADEWVSIGKGTYCEDLLTCYNDGSEGDIPEGRSWKVDMEESTTTRGLYRFIPYHQYSPIAELFGGADNVYMIIHAENPEKVWMEDFDPYPEYEMYFFSQRCEEAGWKDTEFVYGRLADGCISFPARSIATVNIYGETDEWINTNLNGNFKVYLPGSDPGTSGDDFNLYLSYSYCAAGNKVPVTLTPGQDVASIKYKLYKGDLELTDEVGAEVAKSGTAIEAGTHDFECSSRGIHTLIFCTLDASGNLKKSYVAQIYGSDDDTANWKSLGMTSYNESFVAGFYETISERVLQVEIQEHVSTPGFYRLVNPYATHPDNTAEVHEGHNHYMYIHAEDPECVYIENFPLGTNFGTGSGRVTSTVANMLNAGRTLAEIKGMGTEEVGIINAAREIVFPRYGLWYSERDCFDGYWFASGEHFRVKLPESAGIDRIITDAAPGAPVYYNLQGVRVDNPDGGLYIVRRGTAVSKEMVGR